MPDQTTERLDALADLIQQARGVPMSATCMVNRAEALALIEAAKGALRGDLEEAARLTEDSGKTLARAQTEADQIVRAAREQAEALTAATEVLQVATERAAALEASAAAEAEAFRREADVYVDTRMAGLEAGLQKTLSQIRTMRSRLADRGLDAGETTTFPRVP